jgi:hypothetical protein
VRSRPGALRTSLHRQPGDAAGERSFSIEFLEPAVSAYAFTLG